MISNDDGSIRNDLPIPCWEHIIFPNSATWLGNVPRLISNLYNDYQTGDKKGNGWLTEIILYLEYEICYLL